jgi:hypothetical protein
MSAIETSFPQSSVDELTTRNKILIGGVGALTPIILNLLIVDLKTTFAPFTVLVLSTYFLRVGILFCIGGGMAYFHKQERSALKLFEIGIVAPAMITAFMNGSNIKEANMRASSAPPAVSTSLMDLVIPTAYAQAQEQEIKTYSRPAESVSAQLWRGLSGAAEDQRAWFVIAGTYKVSDSQAEQKARELVRSIARSSSGYKAQIYKNNTHYAVVIGANLTLNGAKALKEKASKADVPSYGDIYLYNPWDSE